MSPRLKYWSVILGGGAALGLAFLAIGISMPHFLARPLVGVTTAFAAIAVFYYFMLRVTVDVLPEAKGHIATLFFLVFVDTFVVIGALAWIPWLWHLIPDLSVTYDGYLRSFYFTAITFTTVGYGDIIPGCNVAGQQFASFTAIFGVSHAITFFGLITLKK